MRLLLGIGDADDAPAAVEAAVGRAREADDDLTVAVYAREGSPAAVERAVRDQLDRLGFAATVERIEGDPGSRLVDRAETGDYDRILLPSGDRSPMGKIRLSEVTEFVILNARTSVTLLR
jgi:nucleotide-binding universal stress UspA family protein